MRSHRRGVSIVEVSIVGSLMGVLAVMLSQAWVDVGRTAADLIGRSRLVQERDMAAAALCRDLGGSFTGAGARNGDKATYRWLRWETEDNATITGNKDLVLYYDGGTGNPAANVNVRYTLEVSDSVKRPYAATYSLIRKETVGSVTTPFVVAKNVLNMTVAPVEGDATALNIVLCFAYGLPDTDVANRGINPHRTTTLTCDLTAKMPSATTAANKKTLPWTIYHYANPVNP